jgi:hypothetical protein
MLYLGYLGDIHSAKENLTLYTSAQPRVYP